MECKVSTDMMTNTIRYLTDCHMQKIYKWITNKIIMMTITVMTVKVGSNNASQDETTSVAMTESNRAMAQVL